MERRTVGVESKTSGGFSPISLPWLDFRERPKAASREGIGGGAGVFGAELFSSKRACTADAEYLASRFASAASRSAASSACRRAFSSASRFAFASASRSFFFLASSFSRI